MPKSGSEVVDSGCIMVATRPREREGKNRLVVGSLLSLHDTLDSRESTTPRMEVSFKEKMSTSVPPSGYQCNFHSRLEADKNLSGGKRDGTHVKVFLDPISPPLDSCRREVTVGSREPLRP